MRIPPPLQPVLLVAGMLLGCNRALAPTPDRNVTPSDAAALSDAWDDDATSSCPPRVIAFSEVLYDPVGADGEGGDEFIELLGLPGERLSGLTLALINGADSRVYDEVPLDLRLNADGLAVIGGAASGWPSSLSRPIQNGPDRADLIRGCDGVVVDSIAWPPDTARTGEGWSVGRCEPGGDAISLHPSPGTLNSSTEQCLAAAPEDRIPDAGGVEHDGSDGASDSGPMAAVDAAADTDGAGWSDLDGGQLAELAAGEPDTTACVPGVSGWRLSEVLYNPQGADSPESEFVELRQVGDPGRTETLHLQHIDGGSGEVLWDRAFVTAEGVRHFLVTDNADADSNTFPRLPTIQNGPDSLVLLDCAARELDRLDWSGSSAEPVRPDAPAADSGESLSRCNADGSADHGRFGAAAPTPGRDAVVFIDPAFCAAPCPSRVGPAPAFLASVLYDPSGVDDDREYVVLGGPPGASTGRLTLEHRSPDSDAPRWSVQIDGRFDEAQGLHVVGGAEIIPRDTLLPASLLNSGGVLVLNGCEGNEVERLQWGHPASPLPHLPSGCAAARTSAGASWRVCCDLYPGDAACPESERP